MAYALHNATNVSQQCTWSYVTIKLNVYMSVSCNCKLLHGGPLITGTLSFHHYNSVNKFWKMFVNFQAHCMLS